MLDFFKAIIDFASMIVDAVVYFITGFAQMFVFIPQAATFLSTVLGYIPPVLLAFGTVALSISVILFIIGR